MNFPFKIIDLTHVLSSKIPTWDGGCCFSLKNKCTYEDCEADVKFCVQSASMNVARFTRCHRSVGFVWSHP